MKEPFEIYHHQFMRELLRRSGPSPQGLGHPREITLEQGNEAVRIAAEAAGQHMVDFLGFTLEEAHEALDQLQAAGPSTRRH